MLWLVTRLEDWLLSRVGFNPCLAIRDMRLRRRRRGAAWLLLVSDALLLVTVAVGLILATEDAFRGRQDAADEARGVFGMLIITQVVMLTAAALTVGAGSIGLERDRRTLDALRMSGLSAWDIVVGKLVAALDPAVDLCVVAVGFALWAAALGGVSVWGLWVSFSLLLLWSTLAGALAVLCSSLPWSAPAATGISMAAIASVWLAVPGGLVYRPPETPPPPMGPLTAGLVVMLIAGLLILLTFRVKESPAQWWAWVRRGLKRGPGALAILTVCIASVVVLARLPIEAMAFAHPWRCLQYQLAGPELVAPGGLAPPAPLARLGAWGLCSVTALLVTSALTVLCTWSYDRPWGRN